MIALDTLPARTQALFAAVVLSAAGMIFLPALGFGLFGDALVTVLQPWVIKRDVAQALVDTHHGLWMPLTYLSWYADSLLFGTDLLRRVNAMNGISVTATNPTYHILVNIVLHVATAAVLLSILRKLGAGFSLALALSALWLVHPVQLDAVALVIQRKSILAALLVLASLRAFLDYQDAPTTRRALLVAGFFVLSLTAKPTGAGLPLVFLFLAWQRHGKIPRRDLALSLPLIAIVGVMIIFASANQLSGGTLRNPGDVWISLANVAFYAKQILLPVAVDAAFPEYTADQMRVLPVVGLLLVAAGTLACVTFSRRRPVLAAGFFFAGLMLAPTLNLSMHLGIQETYDHHAYLPLAGLVIALAAVRPHPAAVATVAAVLAGLSFAQIEKFSALDIDQMLRRANLTSHDRLMLCKTHFEIDANRDEAIACAKKVAASTRYRWQQADAHFFAYMQLKAAKRHDEAAAAMAEMQRIHKLNAEFIDSRWFIKVVRLVKGDKA